MRSLALTSPHMTGRDVERLQEELRRRGRRVEPDGEYGPQTARAVRVQKYRLGFPRKALGTGASVFFQEIILNRRGLPAAYRARQSGRLRYLKRKEARESRTDKVRDKAVDVAEANIGVSENPAGSNRGRGWIDTCQRNAGHPPFRSGEKGWPWCGCAVHEAYLRAGKRLPVEVRSVEWVYYQAKAGHGFFFVPLEDARRGDLVILFGIGTHIELVRHDYRGGTLRTVGGNTSRDTKGSQSNGGGQFARERRPQDVVAIVRVRI